MYIFEVMKDKIKTTKKTQNAENQTFNVIYKKATVLDQHALSVYANGLYIGFIQKCDVLNEYFFYKNIHSEFINGGLTLKECKETLLKFSLPKMFINEHDFFMWQAPNFNFELNSKELIKKALKSGFLIESKKVDSYLINTKYQSS